MLGLPPSCYTANGAPLCFDVPTTVLLLGVAVAMWRASGDAQGAPKATPCAWASASRRSARRPATSCWASTPSPPCPGASRGSPSARAAALALAGFALGPAAARAARPAAGAVEVVGAALAAGRFASCAAAALCLGVGALAVGDAGDDVEAGEGLLGGRSTPNVSLDGVSLKGLFGCLRPREAPPPPDLAAALLADAARSPSQFLIARHDFARPHSDAPPPLAPSSPARLRYVPSPAGTGVTPLAAGRDTRRPVLRALGFSVLGDRPLYELEVTPPGFGAEPRVVKRFEFHLDLCDALLRQSLAAPTPPRAASLDAGATPPKSFGDLFRSAPKSAPPRPPEPEAPGPGVPRRRPDAPAAAHLTDVEAHFERLIADSFRETYGTLASGRVLYRVRVFEDGELKWTCAKSFAQLRALAGLVGRAAPEPDAAPKLQRPAAGERLVPPGRPLRWGHDPDAVPDANAVLNFALAAPAFAETVRLFLESDVVADGADRWDLVAAVDDAGAVTATWATCAAADDARRRGAAARSLALDNAAPALNWLPADPPPFELGGGVGGVAGPPRRCSPPCSRPRARRGRPLRRGRRTLRAPRRPGRREAHRRRRRRRGAGGVGAPPGPDSPSAARRFSRQSIKQGILSLKDGVLDLVISDKAPTPRGHGAPTPRGRRISASLPPAALRASRAQSRLSVDDADGDDDDGRPSDLAPAEAPAASRRPSGGAPRGGLHVADGSTGGCWVSLARYRNALLHTSAWRDFRAVVGRLRSCEPLAEREPGAPARAATLLNLHGALAVHGALAAGAGSGRPTSTQRCRDHDRYALAPGDDDERALGHLEALLRRPACAQLIAANLGEFSGGPARARRPRGAAPLRGAGLRAGARRRAPRQRRRAIERRAAVVDASLDLVVAPRGSSLYDDDGDSRGSLASARATVTASASRSRRPSTRPATTARTRAAAAGARPATTTRSRAARSATATRPSASPSCCPTTSSATPASRAAARGGGGGGGGSRGPRPAGARGDASNPPSAGGAEWCDAAEAQRRLQESRPRGRGAPRARGLREFVDDSDGDGARRSGDDDASSSSSSEEDASVGRADGPASPGRLERRGAAMRNLLDFLASTGGRATAKALDDPRTTTTRAEA
ncbi:hypothetical protein JL722_2166 [Aureococcus anophagefferens]|nr:hypothetical protein JL722_2166 [Aureococcus anophagefferens]